MIHSHKQENGLSSHLSLPCTYARVKTAFKTEAVGMHDPVIMNLAVITGLFLNHELEKGKAPVYMDISEIRLLQEVGK